MSQKITWILCGVLALAAVGCATKEVYAPDWANQPPDLAWSFKDRHGGLVVSVSPAGKTLRVAGTTGLVLGSAVDATVNDAYEEKLREHLADYDMTAVFRQRLEEALAGALKGPASEVSPLTSTAGYQQRRDAEQARYAMFFKHGHKVLLDTVVSYGLYGPEARLVTEFKGELMQLESGREVWSTDLFALAGPLLASSELKNPAGLKVFPDVSGGLKLDEDSADRWLGPEGADQFRQTYEELVSGCVAAALNDLGVMETAEGQYYLGLQSLYGGEYQEAEDRFARAVALDPGYVSARNARSVNAARAGKVEEAVLLARYITYDAPDYGPAWYNLAWWWALELDQPEAARFAYERAKSLGMPASKKIDERLGEE